MLIYGAGGHAHVVAEALIQQNISIQGFFEANPNIHLFDFQHLGLYSSLTLNDQNLIVAIGNNELRKQISLNILHSFGTLIDCDVPDSVIIGEGSMILKGVLIQTYAQIGKHVILNTGSIIEHDCQIADYVHIAPGACLCGSVQIGEGSLVGPKAVVDKGVRIGKFCKIGAGAAVVKDLPDYSVAVGVPAKIIRFEKK